jgi:hypothetical protein
MQRGKQINLGSVFINGWIRRQPGVLRLRRLLVSSRWNAASLSTRRQDDQGRGVAQAYFSCLCRHAGRQRQLDRLLHLGWLPSRGV